MGGPKGSSKNMTVGKEGKEKSDSIKGKKNPNGELVLFGRSIAPPGNMGELESFQPWRGNVVEDVQ